MISINNIAKWELRILVDLALISHLLQSIVAIGAYRNVGFREEPENRTVMIGESLVIACKFTEAASVCHWRKDDKFFFPDGDRQYFNMKPEGNCALNMRFVKLLDTGWYQCVYPKWNKQSVPILLSKPIYLEVIESEMDVLKIDVSGSSLKKINDFSYEINKGLNATFTCRIRTHRSNSTSYQWEMTTADRLQQTLLSPNPNLQMSVTQALNLRCGCEDKEANVKLWSREIIFDAVYATNIVNATYRVMSGNLIFLNCFANGFPQPNIVWQIFNSGNGWETVSFSAQNIVNASKSFVYYKCLAANKFNDRNISYELYVPKINTGISEIQICLIIGGTVITLLVVILITIFVVGAYRRKLFCFKVSAGIQEKRLSFKPNHDWQRACMESYSKTDGSNAYSIGANTIVSFERTWIVPESIYSDLEPHFK